MYIADCSNNRIRKVTMSTATTTPRFHCISFLHLIIPSFTSFLTYLLTYHYSTTPTLVLSTSTPTTSTPSSSSPSLSPSIGIIITIAGTGSTTYSGDNGQATAATLNTPYGVDVDATGDPL